MAYFFGDGSAAWPGSDVILNTRVTCRVLPLALVLAMGGSSFGQRLQFGSQSNESTFGSNDWDSGAALDGTIQPYQPGWDPYADPASQQPALAPPLNGPTPQYGLQGPYANRQRLLDHFLVSHTWLNGNSGSDLEIHSTDLAASFAIPFFGNPAPILITPGFTFHFLDGPDTSSSPGFPDLPPQLYDAYLETSWKPQLNDLFSADLALRVGVYSDFVAVTSDSVRVTGRGLGLITLSPRWQLALGVEYLDRLRVKILPAGGLIWTPNPDVRYEIIFPHPKLAQRLTTFGNTDLWWYVAGEYGGGNWTVDRVGGLNDRVDYNDLRAMLGLEWIGLTGARGFFEVGYVFDREIVYVSSTPKVVPDDTVMLRLGVSF